MLGISRAMLYELLAQKRIASLKIGARRLFLVTDLQTFLDAQSQATQSR